MPFNPISDMAELDAVFAASGDSPVLVYLHDPHCPISRKAERQMTKVDYDIRLIDVSRQSAEKKAIESRTGVRHESPQAFVIVDGKQTWNASHWHITTDDVVAALSAAGATNASAAD